LITYNEKKKVGMVLLWGGGGGGWGVIYNRMYFLVYKKMVYNREAHKPGEGRGSSKRM